MPFRSASAPQRARNIAPHIPSRHSRPDRWSMRRRGQCIALPGIAAGCSAQTRAAVGRTHPVMVRVCSMGVRARILRSWGSGSSMLLRVSVQSSGALRIRKG
ncbi:hypothetical protein BD779DRAFT_1544231 [Infundibulicybe gibba]|nr:hypothetical protein BD779DRAFT_1565491 [Infundibulicybe gibba]KAF8881975.1 hypothetical protein BD779DRAFT_1544231 [Infundibulicybe gibba]